MRDLARMTVDDVFREYFAESSRRGSARALPWVGDLAKVQCEKTDDEDWYTTLIGLVRGVKPMALAILYRQWVGVAGYKLDAERNPVAMGLSLGEVSEELAVEAALAGWLPDQYDTLGVERMVRMLVREARITVAEKLGEMRARARSEAACP